MNDWLALHLASRCYCKWYSRKWASSTKGLFVSGKSMQYNVPALTEDDVCSDLQKHSAKTLNESNVAIVLLNPSKDWAVWKRNNVSGSDVLTLWIINWLYEELTTQATQRIPLAIFLIHKYKMTKENNFFLSLFIWAWHSIFYIFSYNGVRTNVSSKSYSWSIVKVLDFINSLNELRLPFKQ